MVAEPSIQKRQGGTTRVIGSTRLGSFQPPPRLHRSDLRPNSVNKVILMKQDIFPIPSRNPLLSRHARSHCFMPSLFCGCLRAITPKRAGNLKHVIAYMLCYSVFFESSRNISYVQMCTTMQVLPIHPPFILNPDEENTTLVLLPWVDVSMTQLGPFFCSWDQPIILCDAAFG